MNTALYTPQRAAQWLRERVTGSLCTDSRQVRAGDGFIAWLGAAADGRTHVVQALAAGAAACLVERSGVKDFCFDSPLVADYAELKAATGSIAADYFDHPSLGLQCVAVTGTNGKTSTTWWLAQALSRVGLRCAAIGTLGIGEPGAPGGMVDTGLTTPDPVLLQKELRQLVASGFAACAVEASSIGIREHRMDSVALSVAVFTNFTQDHLDYHGSMAAYWAAKAALFDWPTLHAAVINLDDAKGKELAASAAQRKLDIWTVSCCLPARVRAENIRDTAQGVSFDITEGEQRFGLQTAMVGRFNVANLLGVVASMRAMGVPLRAAVNACTALLPVPGRMEVLSAAGMPLVVVDYAHTPDALDKALDALKPLATARGGAVWCVFGCGGDRDASKRALMAQAAERCAQHLIVTSDNPRSEDPLAIIQQIVQGLRRPACAAVEPDRALAIARAVSQAHANDVVLVAGKGHEQYQEVGPTRFVFSDRLQAERALTARRLALESRT